MRVGRLPLFIPFLVHRLGGERPWAHGQKTATQSSPTKGNLTEEGAQRWLMVHRKSSDLDAITLPLHLIALDRRVFSLPLQTGLDTSLPI